MNPTIELIIRNKEIHFCKKDNLTTGQQKNAIKVNFEGDGWEGLDREAIFRVDKDIFPSINIKENIIEIPVNICKDEYLGRIVYIGFRGTKKEGTVELDSKNVDTQIVYTTPYFRLGVVEQGADPGEVEPGVPIITPYDEAVRLAKSWAIGPNSTDQNPNETNNAKYWSDQAKVNAENVNEYANKAKTEADRAETAAKSVKSSAEAAAKSAQEAGQYAENAKTAVSEYPRIDEHGHWERYDPESGKWVDTGALAEFKIRKTYSTITEMNEHWSDSDVFVNDFVMIAGEVEPDNGKLYVKLADSNAKYQYIGDISGAQGIKGESAYDIAVAEKQYEGTKEDFAKFLGEAVNNEPDRQKKEIDRDNAEKNRNYAESLRVQNETQRQSNETAREVWESYNQDKTYYHGNKVSLNGNSYVCVVESTTNHPGQSNDWLLIAQKGDGLVIKDKYTTVEELRAANPNHTYTYQVEQPNSEFYIYSDIAGDWVSIGALGSYTAGTGIEITDGVISATAEVYKAGDGISITNSSISAQLGSGLKFDTEKKIILNESVFVGYTDAEITNFYNAVTV